MILVGLFCLHSVSLSACAVEQDFRNTGSPAPGAIPKDAQQSVARHNMLNTGSSGSRVTPKEAQQIVALHNRIRAQVGVGPLRWSEEVAAYSQKWADHLASSRCGMEHRPRSGRWQQQYGENLFIGTAGHYGTSDAVMVWEEEKNKYPGGPLQSSRWAAAGHYTQLVWRDTMRIGCGTAVCKGKLIVVCNYDPRGNYLGQSPY